MSAPDIQIARAPVTEKDWLTSATERACPRGLQLIYCVDAGSPTVAGLRRSHVLAVKIRRATRRFPRTGYGKLQSQITNAAESVVLNIVEGCGGRTPKDFARFLDHSIKSTSELEAQLELAKDYGALQTVCTTCSPQKSSKSGACSACCEPKFFSAENRRRRQANWLPGPLATWCTHSLGSPRRSSGAIAPRLPCQISAGTSP